MSEYVHTQGPIYGTPIYGVAGDVPVEKDAPPSSYAVASALKGETGSIPRLIGLTALRGVFIVPGIWIGTKLTKAELSLLQILVLALSTSATITLGMMGYYAVMRRFS